MSGRTCQFCGKPLWRIRRGEGEFCSREHRNQYQLRKGLSQLAEGEKMATLRRKQDQVAIGALLRPAGPAAAEARRSFIWQNLSANRDSSVVLPVLELASTFRLVDSPLTTVRPQGRPGARLARGPASLQIKMSRQPAMPPFHAEARNVRGRVGGRRGAGTAAPPARARHIFTERRAAGPKLRVRHTPSAPRSGLRPQPAAAGSSIGAARAGVPSAEALGRFSGKSGRPARLLCNLAPVSLRNPLVPAIPLQASPLDMPLARPAAMPYGAAAPQAEQRSVISRWEPAVFQYATLEEKWLIVLGENNLSLPPARQLALHSLPGVVRRMPARWRGAAKAPDYSRLRAALVRGHCKLPTPRFRPQPAIVLAGTHVGPLTAGLDRQQQKPRCGVHPVLAGTLAMPEPARAVIRMLPQRSGQLRAIQEVVLPPPPPSTAVLRQYLDRAGAPPAAAALGLRYSGSRSVEQSPAVLILEARQAELPFVMHEVFFEPPQVEIHGDLETLLQPEAGAPLKLEEHFSAGIANWSAGAADWKVDLAGVRVGSAAYFTPSFGLNDYEAEFLARVEKGGLTWMCRAADAQNCYRLRFEVNAEGTLELIRNAVIEGVAEASRTVALSGKPKAAMTVHVRIKNSEFAVSIDGHEIDRWTECRLAPGGIGFQTNPGDRARIYWLRVVSTIPPSPTGKSDK